MALKAAKNVDARKEQTERVRLTIKQVRVDRPGEGERGGPVRGLVQGDVGAEAPGDVAAQVGVGDGHRRRRDVRHGSNGGRA